MSDIATKLPPRLNARAGAVALALGAPMNLLLHLQGARLAPLAYAAWLVFSFGALCFAGEMGAERPLNRAGLVAFAAAFCADTVALVAAGAEARARLLYAFCLLAALLFWSVALMHRARTARAVGSVGAALGGAAIALLIAAHLLVGTATIAGFSQLFAALGDPGQATAGALLAIDAVACLWAFAVAILLWRGQLRA